MPDIPKYIGNQFPSATSIVSANGSQIKLIFTSSANKKYEIALLNASVVYYESNVIGQYARFSCEHRL